MTDYYTRQTHAELLDGFREYLEEEECLDGIAKVTAMWEFSEYFDETCECCGPQWDYGIRFKYIGDDGIMDEHEAAFTTINMVEEWIKENK